jgi:hypothetical protein
MTYSKSDQPKTETIKTFEDPTTRQYTIFHDKRGNLVDDGRKVFEYDALNRLTGVWQSMGGGQTGSTYSYGTKGHPIAAFTYDGYGSGGGRCGNRVTHRRLEINAFMRCSYKPSSQ